MNKGMILLLFVIFALPGCSEKDASPAVEVKYEVLTSSGDWHGEYIDQRGERICLCDIPLPTNGWTRTLTVSERPFTLHLDATTDHYLFGQTGAPDVTANIYLDNELVVSNTSNWAPGVASADYVVK